MILLLLPLLAVMALLTFAAVAMAASPQISLLSAGPALYPLSTGRWGGDLGLGRLEKDLWEVEAQQVASCPASVEA